MSRGGRRREIVTREAEARRADEAEDARAFVIELAQSMLAARLVAAHRACLAAGLFPRTLGGGAEEESRSPVSFRVPVRTPPYVDKLPKSPESRSTPGQEEK